MNFSENEFIPGFPGSRGSRVSRQSGVITRGSEPPSTRAGGQDDGSLTNSLKTCCPPEIVASGSYGVPVGECVLPAREIGASGSCGVPVGERVAY